MSRETHQPRPDDRPETFDGWLNRTSPELSWHWPHLIHVRKHLEDVTAGRCRKLLVSLPPQHGKLIGHETPILTTTGWKTHGDLRIGDFVYGSDGSPVRVVATSEEGDASWEVELTDGEVIRCHGRHEWVVHDRSIHRSRTVETEWMAREGVWEDDRARFSVEWVPLRGSDTDLPVEPYSLGAWLGDGSSSKPCITHSPNDSAVALEIGRHYPRTAIYTHKTTGVLTSTYNGTMGHAGPFWVALKSAGVVRNKHIPDAYFVSSDEQRRQLLAGLIDTDGYVHHRTRRVCFSTSSPRLAADTSALIRTFGWRATISRAEPSISTSGIIGRKPVYQVTFSPSGAIPCRLGRKRTDGFQVRYRRRGIRSVKRCEPRPGRCVQIENLDGIYLVGRGLVPTHNSTVAIRYVVWRMLHNPGVRTAVCAYNQTYANRLSRACRRVVRDAGMTFGEKNEQREWELSNGSMLLAVGVGGGLTGRSVDLGYLDDVVKSREEADSEAFREKVWEWYMDDFSTRLQEGASIVAVNTRWHEDDLFGRILSSEDGPNWRYVKLPALAEEDDPLGRPLGAPLCPERFTLETLQERQRILGEGFSGLYQQNPVPRGGLFFRREWFGLVDAVPTDAKVRRLRYWDLSATTKDTSCYTAGVLMSRATNPDRYYVEDVIRGRWIPADRNEVILQTAQADSKRPGFERTWFEEQPGGAGVETSDALIRKLAGLPVRSDRVTGDKRTRAEPLADAARGSSGQGGVVYLVKAGWTGAFLGELASFPRGQWADQVDSSSGAFNKLGRGVRVMLVNG